MTLKKSYSDKWKVIRKHLNYKIDLRKPISTKDKRIITRYYNAFKDLNSGPTIEYKPRSPKKLIKGKKLAKNKSVPLFKTVFIPQRVPVKNARVKIKGNRFVIKKKYFIENMILFDSERLVQESYDYLEEVIPDSEESWRIMAGPYHFIAGSYQDKSLLINAILELLDRYDPEQAAETWLYGVVNAQEALGREEKFETERAERKKQKRLSKRQKLRMK